MKTFNNKDLKISEYAVRFIKPTNKTVIGYIKTGLLTDFKTGRNYYLQDNTLVHVIYECTKNRVSYYKLLKV